MTRPMILLTSFRGRFLLVVILAAVVPLVLIGLWLTRSVAGAGADLLRSELAESLEHIAAPVRERWSHRLGELQLLANNDVAIRTVSSADAGISPADAAYLEQLAGSLSNTIPGFEYRDDTGRVRWASPEPRRDTAGRPAQGFGFSNDVRSMTVRLPIQGIAGPRASGEVVAYVSLAAVIPIDTSLRLPNGAQLQVMESATGVSLTPSLAPDAALRRSRFTTSGGEWLAVRRSLADPKLELILAAPLAAYVEPFKRAARRGVTTLLIVSLLALGFSAFLTTRLTASLETLAVGADAVSAGDLDHRLEGRGPHEVRRVVKAFNSMVENLRRTLGELSQRQTLAAVGEYAATLSHEVRNGLTAIRVDLQRAEEKTTKDWPGRPLITRALENVKRLDGIVTRSLHLSRSGRVPRRRVDLRTVMTKAAQGADPSFAARGTLLERSMGNGGPSWVLGDALALEQLFLNLLLNAAQALEAGGSASLSLEHKDTEALIVIRDTGAGIAPEDLAHVLDPFFSTKTDGTGLGLPIAHQISVAHGGSLRIESIQGIGTRIEVRLPLVAVSLS